MASHADVEKRLESERQFHNDRFAKENRQSVQGFYRTIDNCFDDYRTTVHRLLQGKKVLEYGCAKGDNAFALAPDCEVFHGIDISDVAIEKARQESENKGIQNAKFDVMNAEQLEFPDASFDLIFGSGIIHHLDVPKAYGELSRVLKPGGHAVFVEPLGHNPLINRFRNKTPALRTPDEHPLLKSDILLANRYFDHVSLKLYGLATLGAIPAMKLGLGQPVILVGEVLDKVLLRIPGLKWWAWYSLIVFRKDRHI